MNFVEIKKFNQQNEEGKALINLDNVVAVSQQHKHFTRLINQETNELVSETEDSPRYAILTNVHQTHIVGQDTYDMLKTKLNDFTEITKINSKGEEGKALVNLNNVVSMVQQPKETEINEETGEETEKPTKFALLTEDVNSKVFFVGETEYERLVKELSK